MKVLSIAILIFSYSLMPSLYASDHESTGTEQTRKISTLFCGVVDFQPHKTNYFIISTSNYSNPDEEQHLEEIKFQFSAKRGININDRYAVYAAYTQKSFLQVLKDSKPIRENNYNPELIFQVCPSNFNFFDDKLKLSAIDLGFEHESNGLGADDELDNGWNRWYINQHWSLLEIFVLSIKTWNRTETKFEKLESELGNSEIRIQCWDCFDDIFINVIGRYDLSNKKGGVQADLVFKESFFGTDPIWGDLFDFYIHYWDGYGESLNRQAISQTRWGMGFAYGGFNSKKKK